MHALPAVALASVAFFGVADAIHCNATYAWYSWATNSNADDPCQLVSDLYTSCTPNADLLQPLSYNLSGMNFYPGPNSSVQNSCTCSYVMYNLMSACSDCQVGLSAPAAWPAYKDWTRSCDTSNTGAIYPDALPNNFSNPIPTWARFATPANGDYRWSYSLSRARVVGHLPNTNIFALAATSSSCPQASPALSIGSAFIGLAVGLLLASLAFLFHRRRRARVIPTPTRYHTAPDNTPLYPLVPRPAHSQGTNFLRRMLEQYHENDPNRIDPFDISAASPGSFPPHPAVYPHLRGHGFPPALSIQSVSRGPSRQPSASSLTPITFAPHPSLRHSRSQSQSKPGSRPQTAASQFTTSGPAVPGPSTAPLQTISPLELPNPLPPPDRNLPVSEEPPTYWSDPPVYRRKT